MARTLAGNDCLDICLDIYVKVIHFLPIIGLV
jgi:hypothetical protein